jgi:hypothetical protein
MKATGPPQGWYPNPEGAGWRYWDGRAWTGRFRGHNEPYPPVVRTRRTLWGAGALIVIGVAVAYLLPFFGWMLSPLVGMVAVRNREALWPSTPRPVAVRAAVLAVIGLWLPALLTPVFYVLGIEVSTFWLILPLGGPSHWQTWALPALATLPLVGLGVALSALQRTPWFWVITMWLAPWVHLAVFSLTPQEFTA